MDAPELLHLGEPLPPNNPHAVSVHLPTWRDNIGWAEREQRVIEAMNTGYPRFFIPRVVIELSEHLLHKLPSKFDETQTTALAFASWKYTKWFIRYLWEGSAPFNSPSQAYVVFEGGPIIESSAGWSAQDVDKHRAEGRDVLFLVPFPSDMMVTARKLVQHSGYAISSRRAIHWLENLGLRSRPEPTSTAESVLTNQLCSLRRVGEGCALCRTMEHHSKLPRTTSGHLADASTAETVLRWRIAAWSGCKCSTNPNLQGPTSTSDLPTPINSSPSSPELIGCSNNLDPDKDVFLYPSGMAAIAAAFHAVIKDKPDARVAVIGFLYLDTIKILHRVLGEERVPIISYDELDWFEAQLRSGSQYEAVFTEFPGNPLLQSPDLARLREMSFTYNFKLVVDNTIGTTASLDLLDDCDMICTSLTKMFSGGCNVMGGSVVINPRGPVDRVDFLRESLPLMNPEKGVYFGEDIQVMEKNSVDFVDRVFKASRNAEAMLGVLEAHPAVKKLSYPKGSKTQHLYDRFKKPGAGYGFLMSIEFHTEGQAVAFYDNFEVAKGPSLGTNFTLCCPYSILAHYRELDWAASHGVVPHLVRISFGLEGVEWLRARVVKALEAVDCAPK
ncbi:putative cystathionine gamma-synthase/beta-lyase [Cladorrhinum samala]|uniref:Cystathionine gamma-synthase/beta-lyase n=1 Tax=Cladorrhinum samala TaxID=585594 RepID=A0AAV9HZJ8_9PEZI|nr:putative cystathionine gamma-synthase/beta-lyase [Cladorrhinum samala]